MVGKNAPAATHKRILQSVCNCTGKWLGKTHLRPHTKEFFKVFAIARENGWEKHACGHTQKNSSKCLQLHGKMGGKNTPAATHKRILQSVCNCTGKWVGKTRLR